MFGYSVLASCYGKDTNKPYFVSGIEETLEWQIEIRLKQSEATRTGQLLGVRVFPFWRRKAERFDCLKWLCVEK